jgi:hypothetical protein
MWNGIVQTVSKMRSDSVSLHQASRQFGLKPCVVVRLGGSALRKLKNGRYVAKPSDRLLRVVVLPGRDGLREIAVSDSREASMVGKYWAAVQKHLATGDSSVLRRLRRRTVRDANGARIRLLTNLEQLNSMGSAGVLSFESLYARTS